MKPLLKWVGGKARLLPTIRSVLNLEGKDHLGPDVTYYEPFVGGGAVFFDIREHSNCPAYLGDMNPNLINLYQRVRDDPHAVWAEVQKILASEPKFAAIRTEINGNLHSPLTIRDAALMMVFNRGCFNGMWRCNRQGLLNTPAGSTWPPPNKTRKNYELYSKALQNTTIRHAGFEEMPAPKEGDLVFLDPPYLSQFRSYTKGAFSAVHHEALKEKANDWAERGALVVLCASNTRASYLMYGEPTHRQVISRNVGVGDRKKAAEVFHVYKR